MSALFEAVTAHDRLIEEGNRLLHGGRAGDAKRRYRQAYGLRPGARAAYGLGLVSEALGDAAAARRHYEEALGFDPGFPEARVNLGNLLREARDFDGALHQHVVALGLAPRHPLTRYNLGATFAAQGVTAAARHMLGACLADAPDFALARKALARLGPGRGPARSAAANNCANALAHAAAGRDPEAAACFEAFLAQAPEDIAAWTDYGAALLRLGRPDEALAAQQRAVALDPAFAPALHNLGATLQALGRHAGAVAAYREALAHHPGLGLSWVGLGRAYAATGRPGQAWDAFHVATRIEPGRPEALSELAEVSRLLGRREAAVSAMRRLEALRPDDALVHNNLGTFLLDQGRADEALRHFDKAAALNSGSVLVHANRGAVFELTGRFEAADEAYSRAAALSPADAGLLSRRIHVAQHVCRWDGIETLFAEAQAAARSGALATAQPFSLLAVPGITAADQLAVSRAFAARNFAHLRQVELPPPGRADKGRIRIGYLSADLQDHATAWLVAEIFELHDRARFEVFAYAYGKVAEDATRKRLRQGVDRFTEVHALSDEDAARLIRRDGIDVLVDLKGYTQGTRTGILAPRPGRVQVSYLGFPGTSGADFMDYIVADPIVIPPELEPCYSERVLRLPVCYQPNDRKRPVGPRPERSRVGLPEHAVVFCSFNNVYKITPEVFDLWCRLLRAVPDSVLWILSGRDAANRNLRREAERRGVAGARLLFAPRAGLAEHLARFGCADLFLDTYPCTAHTTASDALWCGVPVVTRMGETFASRVAASLLHAVGLPQLATRDAEGYYALALRLARAPEELRALRAHLERVRLSCALFDSAAYTRDLEGLYEEALRRGPAIA